MIRTAAVLGLAMLASAVPASADYDCGHAVALGPSAVRPFKTRDTYLASLEDYRPCLARPQSAAKNKLEDCLYRGHLVAQAASCELGHPEKAIPALTELGFGFTEGENARQVFAYLGAFGAELKKRFPESRYEDELSEGLIASDVQLGETEAAIAGRLNYLEKYPRGMWSLDARAHLAELYSDIWYYLSPTNPEYLGDFKEGACDVSTGDPKRDAAVAEARRLDAIRTYEDLLNPSLAPLRNKTPEWARSDQIKRENAQASLERLKRREMWSEGTGVCREEGC